MEEKLSEIQSLKMKYGNTVSEILDYLEDAKRECAEHKPPEGKKPGRDVPEHDCL